MHCLLALLFWSFHTQSDALLLDHLLHVRRVTLQQESTVCMYFTQRRGILVSLQQFAVFTNLQCLYTGLGRGETLTLYHSVRECGFPELRLGYFTTCMHKHTRTSGYANAVMCANLNQHGTLNISRVQCLSRTGWDTEQPSYFHRHLPANVMTGVPQIAASSFISASVS